MYHNRETMLGKRCYGNTIYMIGSVVVFSTKKRIEVEILKEPLSYDVLGECQSAVSTLCLHKVRTYGFRIFKFRDPPYNPFCYLCPYERFCLITVWGLQILVSTPCRNPLVFAQAPQALSPYGSTLNG